MVPSSVHREIRTKQLKVPENKSEILELISDTGDAEFPIYREVSLTDIAKTVATGLKFLFIFTDFISSTLMSVLFYSTI